MQSGLNGGDDGKPNNPLQLHSLMAFSWTGTLDTVAILSWPVD